MNHYKYIIEKMAEDESFFQKHKGKIIGATVGAGAIGAGVVGAKKFGLKGLNSAKSSPKKSNFYNIQVKPNTNPIKNTSNSDFKDSQILKNFLNDTGAKPNKKPNAIPKPDKNSVPVDNLRPTMNNAQNNLDKVKNMADDLNKKVNNTRAAGMESGETMEDFLNRRSGNKKGA